MTDLTRARALLSEAGLPVGFKSTLLYKLSEATVCDPAALLSQESLKVIGIGLTLEKVPGSNRLAQLARKTISGIIVGFYRWHGLLRAAAAGRRAELLGKTVSDQISHGLLGLKRLDGTPLNPRAPDRVAGDKRQSRGRQSGLVCRRLGSTAGRAPGQCSFTCGSVRRTISRASVSSATLTQPCSASSCIL